MNALAARVVFTTLLLASTLFAQTPQERGIRRNEPGAFQGYVIIQAEEAVYLVDMEGRPVHRWELPDGVGSCSLMDDGSLMLCTAEPDAPLFNSAGQNGRFQRLAWDGTLLWQFTFATEDHVGHHDFALTPDGTLLAIAWEKKTAFEAEQAGRHPDSIHLDGFWPDMVVEIEPLGSDDGEIIWEWHVWDHLVQDVDETKENYGIVADHPELVDINGDVFEPMSSEDVARLQALGYLAGDQQSAGQFTSRRRQDWLHTNGIDYHPDLDQIALCVPIFGEIWIIDHSTTLEEAEGHEGGSAGRGGDLLYRWGNPASYRKGANEDKKLFFQHDIRWIPPGLPGAGNLTVFNNGRDRFPEDPDANHSSFIELTPPLREDGTYALAGSGVFGPERPTWEFGPADPSHPGFFFSDFISGGHRLPNGNSLICEGDKGRVIEVTRAGEVVWEYLTPYALPPEVAAEFGVPPYTLWRATRVAPDHPALDGRKLEPLDRE